MPSDKHNSRMAISSSYEKDKETSENAIVGEIYQLCSQHIKGKK